MALAFSTPSALQVLALPELQMHRLGGAVRQVFFRVTRMGAPLTWFWVYTAAAAQGFSLYNHGQVRLGFGSCGCRSGCPPATKPLGAL